MNQTQDGHAVDPKELWKYHKYLYELHTFANEIENVACAEGLNPEGFTGLLSPLQEGCNQLADHVVSPAFMKFKDKISGLADAVEKSAKSYGLTDEMVAQGWDEMYNDPGVS